MPARLERLDAHRQSIVELTPDADAATSATAAIELAEAQLKKAGYRAERYDSGATLSYDFNLLVPLNFEAFGVRYGLPNALTFTRTSIFPMTDLQLP